MFIARHGDVIIKQVNSIPEDATKKQGLTLALGEVTGHSHRIENLKAGALFEYQEKTYLDIHHEIATLVHKEHKALELPRGQYEVIIQRQYSDIEEWEKVRD